MLGGIIGFGFELLLSCCSLLPNSNRRTAVDHHGQQERDEENDAILIVTSEDRDTGAMPFPWPVIDQTSFFFFEGKLETF